MDIDRLLHNLKEVLPRFQNRHYDTFDIRLDLMVEDIIKSIEEFKSKYDKLARISIETAFDSQNKDTEFLLRTLLSQNKIKFDEEKKEYVNPQQTEEFRVNGIMFAKEKVYLINDDKLDEYTRQLEYKYNSMNERIDEVIKEFKSIISNPDIRELSKYKDLIETLSNYIGMLNYIKDGNNKPYEDILSYDELDNFYKIIKEALSDIGKLPPEALDDNFENK